MTSKQFANWCRGLAREYGGKMTVVSDGNVRLDSLSDRWVQRLGRDSLLLSQNPNDPDEWRERLQFVEKRAAQALIAAPVAFRCALPITSKRSDDSNSTNVDVIRFAFSLSLSLGLALAKRYTAYSVAGANGAFYVSGQDNLFECCDRFEAANLKTKEVMNGVRQILNLIPQVEREYEGSDGVTQQIKLLKNCLKAELTDLDHLYLAGHGQFSQLLGSAPESIKGDDAIEIEYFNRLEDIVDKYKVVVRLQPLSLGVIRCSIRSNRKTREVSIPFVDHPATLS